MPVNKTEFKAKALEYLRHVENSGEPLVVTDHGQPTIEVRRYRADGRSPRELLQGSARYHYDPCEPVADDDWEALRAAQSA